MRDLLLSCVQGAGEILLKHFGRRVHPRAKESPSSIVCDADLAAEAFILKKIRRQFPDHHIISEESGVALGAAEYTWVIDPLDGTSNFVAGLPWFGVQIGVLRGTRPILAAMFLPVEGVLYRAEAGQGAWRNDRRVRVSAERELNRVLCAFGFDPAPEKRRRKYVELLFKVAQRARNTRATNSLVDFCYTIDGRLGACINLKTKVWDIVPVSLILPEAGGRFTDLAGRKIEFDLGKKAPERNYAILAASRILHPKLAAVTRAVGARL